MSRYKMGLKLESLEEDNQLPILLKGIKVVRRFND